MGGRLRPALWGSWLFPASPLGGRPRANTVPELSVRWEGESSTSKIVTWGTAADIVKFAMVGICKLCGYAEGTCTTGMRKLHDRSDPACRLHGVTAKVETVQGVLRERGTKQRKHEHRTQQFGGMPQPHKHHTQQLGGHGLAKRLSSSPGEPCQC